MALHHRVSNLQDCMNSTQPYVMALAGHTTWHTWLACLNPTKTLPRSFQPHILLTEQNTELAKDLPAMSSASIADTSCCPDATQLGRLLDDPQHAHGSSVSQQHCSAAQQSDFIIRIAGWLFSCFCAAFLQALQYLVAHQGSSLLQQYTDAAGTGPGWHAVLLSQVTLGFWVTAAASFGSDVCMYGFTLTGTATGKDTGLVAERSFHCGNFGIMLADACGQTRQMVKVYRSLPGCIRSRVQLLTTYVLLKHRQLVWSCFGLDPETQV